MNTNFAQELLERHAVAINVAVEDGSCFMVSEQDALDAIRAALSHATSIDVQVGLPPLPPVDGYDKRIQGHYSAQQMQKSALAATGKQHVGGAMDRDQLGDIVEGMAVSVDVDGLFSTDGRRLFGTITAVQHEDGEKGGLMLLVQEPEPNWKTAPVGEVELLPPEMRPSGPEYLDYLDGPKQVGEVQGDTLVGDEMVQAFKAALSRAQLPGKPRTYFLKDSELPSILMEVLAARQPGADEPVSPMAKMAAALREKAAIEHTEYSQRVQSGEWGTMPEAGTQADFCRYCEGSGWDGESRKTKCPDCSGTGMSRLLIGEAG